MTHTSIAQKMNQEPYQIYEGPELLDAASCTELFQIEEGLTAFLYNQHEKQIQDKSSYDENEVARLVDQWNKTGYIPSHVKEPGLVQEAFRTFSAMQRMEEHGPAALPQALQEMLERTFRQDQMATQKTHNVPALVMELAEGGLRVLKSTLQGFHSIPQPQATTRHAHSQGLAKAVDTWDEQERYNHFILYEKKAQEYLQYEVLLEAHNSITLVIYSPQCYRDTKVTLKQDERSIAAKPFHPKNGKVNFKHLRVGHYQVKYSGAMEYSIEIIIRNPREEKPEEGLN